MAKPASAGTKLKIFTGAGCVSKPDKHEMIYLALQFFAAAILLVGLALMGNQVKLGPALAAASELLWVLVFVPPHLWGGVFLSTILFVMQVRNLIKWHQEGLPWL